MANIYGIARTKAQSDRNIRYSYSNTDAEASQEISIEVGEVSPLPPSTADVNAVSITVVSCGTRGLLMCERAIYAFWAIRACYRITK